MKDGTPLVIATRNEGKLVEVRDQLADLPLRLLSLQDFPNITTIEESGSTFAENAKLKATGYSIQTSLLTLADDSGLEVEALRGAPGIVSARYAGENATDSDRVNRLLAELGMVGDSNRLARFVAAIAIADADGRVLNLSTGICKGSIALSPCGYAGFGYDPVFVPEGYDQSFAELGPSKAKISHRARALKQTREFLLSLTAGFAAGRMTSLHRQS